MLTCWHVGMLLPLCGYAVSIGSLSDQGFDAASPRNGKANDAGSMLIFLLIEKRAGQWSDGGFAVSDHLSISRARGMVAQGLSIFGVSHLSFSAIFEVGQRGLWGSSLGPCAVCNVALMRDSVRVGRSFLHANPQAAMLCLPLRPSWSRMAVIGIASCFPRHLAYKGRKGRGHA